MQYIVINSCKAKSCILLGYLLPSFHLSWLVPLQTWPGIGVMFYPFQGPLGSLGFIVQNLSTLQHMYKVLQATHIIHYLLLTLKRTWFERSRSKSSKVFGLLLPLLNRKKTSALVMSIATMKKSIKYHIMDIPLHAEIHAIHELTYHPEHILHWRLCSTTFLLHAAHTGWWKM